MKKKSFLTSVVVLAASMAIDASAALPDSIAEQLDAQSAYSTKVQESAKTAQNPFVLERPDSSGNQNFADHYSHRSHASHASHASHTSSRY